MLNVVCCSRFQRGKKAKDCHPRCSFEMGRCRKCEFVDVRFAEEQLSMDMDSYGSCSGSCKLQSLLFNDIEMQLMQQNEIYANVIDPSVRVSCFCEIQEGRGISFTCSS